MHSANICIKPCEVCSCGWIGAETCRIQHAGERSVCIRDGKRQNVVIMRTFSKIFGLAGLRLGYGIAHPDLISAFEKIRQPFNINAIAQAGADGMIVQDFAAGGIAIPGTMHGTHTMQGAHTMQSAHAMQGAHAMHATHGMSGLEREQSLLSRSCDGPFSLSGKTTHLM